MTPRVCEVCEERGRRSLMNARLRHLHELEIGDRFLSMDREYVLTHKNKFGTRAKEAGKSDTHIRRWAPISEVEPKV